MFARLPSLTSIRTFEAAARLLSFKAAAAELNVSPTAVSHQIRSLEERLQVKLFQRQTRAVSLTREGEKLAAVSHNLMQELLLAVNALSDTPNRLTLSTTSSFAAMWLVPQLADFQRQHPQIDLQIKADDRISDLERDRSIDLAIRYGRFTPQPGHSLLLHEALGCFATADYWTSLSGRSNLDFFVTTWKNPNLPAIEIAPLLRQQFEGKAGINLRSFDDENQVLQAALAGQGIAILSRALLHNPLHNGWLQPGLDNLSAQLQGLDYYLVTPRRSRENPAAETFSGWLQQRLAKGCE
ncbi:LysR substrate-binding domain-containing protein [Neptuniibacter halophilus]|uniref:LysR substrate-binding domain-containing protein n=1 Tax=Neptuniibacter halophilus TaxID=651666 RepID=UPI0025723976|nr:LysR substrate-binding domain-containing protein [Neptuniibacter halophilus]